jgi:hypothetical protein
MEGRIRPRLIRFAALLILLSSGIAAQTLETNVMYDCDRERMVSPVEMKHC